MAEENNKKGGFGKFVLGALIGAVAGVVASKLISVKIKKSKCDEDCDCDECDCDDCCCHKDDEAPRKKTIKKDTEDEEDF